MKKRLYTREPKLKRLSVLDTEGQLEPSNGPDIDDELQVDLFRAMLRARRFDERQLRLQREGEIGTFAPVRGQEAAQVGAVSCLEPDDWFVPSFRESAAALWRGVPMESLLLYSAGYNEGGWIEPDSRNLPIAVPVASQLPHAAGIAYAMQQRDEESVVMTFFGDGATSEGDFHEALNFAGVYGLPVIFFCQNNQWAISTPRDHQTHSTTIAQKSIAYGFPGLQVDGNDVFAVHRASREAVDRARSGEGPTLIEAVTYRMEVHTTADDPSKYRSREQEQQWEEKDPLDRLQTYLIDQALLTEDALDALSEEIDTEIDEAWEHTRQRIGDLDDPGVIFEHHYHSLTPRLKRQQDAVRSAVQTESRNDDDDDG